MNSLLSPRPDTVVGARRARPVRRGAEGDGGGAGRAAAPGPVAAFARFVLCGGGVGLAAGGAVAGLAELMPWAVANAVVTAASTLLCTELHARFTFGAGRRAGWREHWGSAGSAAAAYLVTSAAVLLLHLLQPSAGALTVQAVYLGASGLAGIGRFVVLRVFVFGGRGEAPGGTGARAEAAVPVRRPVRIPVRPLVWTPVRGRRVDGVAAVVPSHPVPVPVPGPRWGLGGSLV